MALISLAACGCNRPWLLEVHVELAGGVEIPFDVFFDIVERDALVDGAIIGMDTLDVLGSVLFGTERSGAILIRPDLDAREISIMAFARNEGDDLLATGELVATFDNGRAIVTLTLAPWSGTDAGSDAGADAGAEAGMDTGTDAGNGIDAAEDGGETCGNGIAEGGELCDGSDLNGATCATAFPLLYWGGTLACDGTCGGYDTAACTGDVPTEPVLRTPINGDETGDLTPAFGWEASTLLGLATIEYEIVWDVDDTFATPATGFSSTLTFSPPSLAVSTMPPEGARYYWRVRACVFGTTGFCSAYTPSRYLDVARSAHDFNGDAFADFLGGGPGFSSNTGGAVSVPGTATPGVPFDQLYTFGPGQSAGTSVAVAGDFNGDGFADLIVGCDEATVPTENGAVRILFGEGGGSPDTSTEGILNGFTAGDQFGNAAAVAGDLNGDGYDDVIVGAPFNDGGGLDAGAAYVFLGGAGLSFDVFVDLVIAGEFPGDELGAAVSAAGDVNGDGYHDVIVGSRHGGMTEADDTGMAYIFYGNASLDAVPDVTLIGDAPGDRFGGAVAGGGDLNGDGFSDVVVGAADAGLLAGAVYVYYGSVGGAVPAGTLLGVAPGDRYGTSLSMGGDLNGDGLDDLAVGAPFAGTSDVGRAYAYFGSLGVSFDLTQDGVVAPPGAVMALVRFGAAISIVGDFNGDGNDDLVVGAPDFSDLGAPMRVNNGVMYLFFGGGVAIDPNPDHTAPGGMTGDYLGTSVG